MCNQAALTVYMTLMHTLLFGHIPVFKMTDDRSSCRFSDDEEVSERV